VTRDAVLDRLRKTGFSGDMPEHVQGSAAMDARMLWRSRERQLTELRVNRDALTRALMMADVGAALERRANDPGAAPLIQSERLALRAYQRGVIGRCRTDGQQMPPAYAPRLLVRAVEERTGG